MFDSNTPGTPQQELAGGNPILSAATDVDSFNNHTESRPEIASDSSNQDMSTELSERTRSEVTISDTRSSQDLEEIASSTNGDGADDFHHDQVLDVPVNATDQSADGPRDRFNFDAEAQDARIMGDTVQTFRNHGVSYGDIAEEDFQRKFKKLEEDFKYLLKDFDMSTERRHTAAIEAKNVSRLLDEERRHNTKVTRQTNLRITELERSEKALEESNLNLTVKLRALEGVEAERTDMEAALNRKNEAYLQVKKDLKDVQHSEEKLKSVNQVQKQELDQIRSQNSRLNSEQELLGNDLIKAIDDNNKLCMELGRFMEMYTHQGHEIDAISQVQLVPEGPVAMGLHNDLEDVLSISADSNRYSYDMIPMSNRTNSIATTQCQSAARSHPGTPSVNDSNAIVRNQVGDSTDASTSNTTRADNIALKGVTVGTQTDETGGHYSHNRGGSSNSSHDAGTQTSRSISSNGTAVPGNNRLDSSGSISSDETQISPKTLPSSRNPKRRVLIQYDEMDKNSDVDKSPGLGQQSMSPDDVSTVSDGEPDSITWKIQRAIDSIKVGVAANVNTQDQSLELIHGDGTATRSEPAASEGSSSTDRQSSQGSSNSSRLRAQQSNVSNASEKSDQTNMSYLTIPYQLNGTQGRIAFLGIVHPPSAQARQVLDGKQPNPVIPIEMIPASDQAQSDENSIRQARALSKEFKNAEIVYTDHLESVAHQKLDEWGRQYLAGIIPIELDSRPAHQDEQRDGIDKEGNVSAPDTPRQSRSGFRSLRNTVKRPKKHPVLSFIVDLHVLAITLPFMLCREVLESCATFVRASLRGPGSDRWTHLAFAVWAVLFAYTIKHMHENWFVANTSNMRGKVMGWREDHWDSNALRYVRWYLQRSIERQIYSGQHLILT